MKREKGPHNCLTCTTSNTCRSLSCVNFIWYREPRNRVGSRLMTNNFRSAERRVAAWLVYTDIWYDFIDVITPQNGLRRCNNSTAKKVYESLSWGLRAVMFWIDFLNIYKLMWIMKSVDVYVRAEPPSILIVVNGSRRIIWARDWSGNLEGSNVGKNKLIVHACVLRR